MEEVNYDFEHGAKSSVGTSVVQMTTTNFVCRKGVLIKAANANTGIVYVGKSDVTAGSADATDGMELSAGQSLLLEVDNVNKVYLIASASGQKVFWITA